MRKSARFCVHMCENKSIFEKYENESILVKIPEDESI